MGAMMLGFYLSRLSALALFVVVALVMPVVESGDAEALLALKASVDSMHVLPWPEGGDVCRWRGVKDCLGGRVTKLVLEYLNLTGRLDSGILSSMDQLRVLSFKGNFISGNVPDLSSLINLKSVYLNGNNFSGVIPPSLDTLHRLKVFVLASNRISGEIPESLARLPRLYILYLQDNELRGKIPALNQTTLRSFNVSNNHLSGEIPVTPAMLRFNSLSFAGNIGLCGEQVGKPCTSTEVEVPAISSPGTAISAASLKSPNHRRGRIIAIIAGTVGGFLLIVCCLIICGVIVTYRGQSHRRDRVADGRAKPVEVASIDYGEKQGEFSWEGDGLGSLVFLGVGDQQMNYILDDLLKASAETLGRGALGSTYKAVMESGYIVTVKRLKDARYPQIVEFRRHIELLGSLRHPNMVPLRAYFQAKEERLLVYDYFPNGSLFTLIHGSRTSGNGKPLHWTSCLKIAEDLAAGLLYIHQSHGLAHGNLKSSNVLMGPDFESCLTDYGLNCFRDPDSLYDPSAAPPFYIAPECRDPSSLPTLPSDIYSFGVLLLELLTGKTPFQDLTPDQIPGWVKSAREESESEQEPDTPSSSEASEEKVQALLNIVTACLCLVPEDRPTAREVMKMIRDARLDSNASSNRSEQSPGQWSDPGGP